VKNSILAISHHQQQHQQTAATVVTIINDIVIFHRHRSSMMRSRFSVSSKGANRGGGFPPRSKQRGSPHKGDFKPLG
jgi:hypothetical protein